MTPTANFYLDNMGYCSSTAELMSILQDENFLRIKIKITQIFYRILHHPTSGDLEPTYSRNYLYLTFSFDLTQVVPLTEQKIHQELN